MSQPNRFARSFGFVAVVLAPTLGFAAQGPGVSEGAADRFTQATAAAMVLFPIVAVVVFALARLLAGRN